MGWFVWLIVAVALAIGEVLTPGMFFLGPVALAAGAAAVAAALGGTLAGVITFIVCAILSLLILRPIARAHLRLPAISRTGTAALAGRKATVVRRVTEAGGLVRIGGEEWSARAYLAGQELEVGAQVEVVQIEGATALVMQ